MRCSACQTDNPDSARTCAKCGAKLPAADFSDAAMGTMYEGAGGTGGEVAPLSSYEGPTVQVGAEPEIPAGAIPSRIENYEILRKPDGTLWELGRGAMGITYKAHDTDLQVDVVLKVINPAALANSDARERFLREARAAAKLRHANIASVFRLGLVNGIQFYAMEFCDGESLHQYIERHGPLELKLALEITQQVTNALVVAQELGVVHRDIKPSNLMMTGRPPEEFTVKVIDFGLAKLGVPGTAEASEVTIGSARSGFVGTAHFASPEQLEDRTVDFRSDIYSVGVTLWFMLTGKPLFQGSMARVVMQHLSMRPPLEKISGLTPGANALLEKMLAKSPDDRPTSSRELRASIANCLAEISPGRPPAPQSALPVTTPPGSSSARFAPPPSKADDDIAETQKAPEPPAAPLIPPPLPPTPKPVTNPALIIAAAVVVMLVLALGGLAFSPIGKRLFRGGVNASGSTRRIQNEKPVEPETPPPGAVAESQIAFRDARTAQDAAEKLSLAAHNYEVNRQLLELVQKRPIPDPDAVQQYRLSEQAIERNIIDAETAYLLAAKRLNKLPGDAQRAAFTKLEDDVASAGVNWRTRVLEIIRREIPKVAPETVRIDPALREELKQLQAGQ